jgi:putative peptide zinc metalloprotease protein
VSGNTVDQTNRAIAFASCVDCRTAAVAFQVVLVEGTPSVIVPINTATAVNDKCTQCLTYAGAKQFVLRVDGPVMLTDEGQARVDTLRQELRQLGSDVATDTPAELVTSVDTLEAQLFDIYTTELTTATGEHEHPDVVQES